MWTRAIAALALFVACASTPAEPAKKGKRHRKPHPTEVKAEDEADDDTVTITDSDEEEEVDQPSTKRATKKPAKKGRKLAAQHEASEPAKRKTKKGDDEDEAAEASKKTKQGGDEEESETPKKAKKADKEQSRATPKKTKKAADEEEASATPKKAKKGADEEEASETPKKGKTSKRVAKAGTKGKGKKAKQTDETTEAKEEEEADAPKQKPSKEVDAGEEPASSSDDEDNASGGSKQKVAAKKPTKKPRAKAQAKPAPPKKRASDEVVTVDMGNIPPKDVNSSEPDTTKRAKPAPAKEPHVIEMEEDPVGKSDERVATASEPDDSTDATAPDSGEPAERPEKPAAPPPPAMPRSINDRSLVIAPKKLELHAGLQVAMVTLPGSMAGTTVSSTAEGLELGASYGITDHAEIGLDYVAGISPGSLEGPFALRGAYSIVRRPKLDVALAGALAVDFLSVTDPNTMMASTTTAASLQLGGWVRYRATPKLSVFTGLPALPASTASLSKLVFPLPPFDYQLAVGLTSGGAIALELPVGVGFQATPALYTFATLDLAHIRLSNTENAFLFADFIPIALGGFYSLQSLDVGAQLADDLEQGSDYLRFELLARYWFK